MHILVPINGSDSSLRALRFGARMAREMHADISVVHFTDEETDATETIEDRARDVLRDEGIDAEPEVSVDIELEFRPGERVGEEILALVESQGFDHVVMGHHGSGTVERAILGSAAETVLQSERVPVTVVP